MSIYVRTKKSIYPICQAEGRWKELGYRVVGSKIDLISYDEIIKQADTIKELLDGIIIDYGGYKHFVNQPINNALTNIVKTDYIMKGIKEGTIKVYGAIWTNDGLIYQAKINDKGELELL